MKSLVLANHCDDWLAERMVTDALGAELPDYDLWFEDGAAAGPGRTRSDRLRGARAVRRHLRDGDALVLAGTLLDPGRQGPAYQRDLRRLVRLAAAARTAGCPVAIIGASVERCAGYRVARAVRWLARLANVLVVRDRYSASNLVEAGVPAPVRVGPDPAWVLLARPPGPAPSPRSAQVVVAGTVDGLRGDAAGLAASLRRTFDRETVVRYQPWECTTPGGAAAMLSAYFDRPVERLPVPQSLAEASRALRGAGLVVATTHGALLAAAASGSPVLVASRYRIPVAVAAQLEIPAVHLPAASGDIDLAVRAASSGAVVPEALVAQQVAGARSVLRLLRVVASRGGDDEPAVLAGLHLEPRP